MHLKINTAALVSHDVPISDDAARAVRMGFNPSSMPRVDALKAMAAAMLSELEGIRREAVMAEGDVPEALALELDQAEIEIRAGSMWSVAAATHRL